MTGTDPRSDAYLNALARRSVSGDSLSKNEQFELKEAVRTDTADVKDILKGDK